MSKEKCPYCGDAKLTSGLLHCGTWQVLSEARHRTPRCYENELTFLKVDKARLEAELAAARAGKCRLCTVRNPCSICMEIAGGALYQKHNVTATVRECGAFKPKETK